MDKCMLSIFAYLVVISVVGSFVAAFLHTAVTYIQNPELAQLPNFCAWCKEEEGVVCCSRASCMHCCRAYEEHFNLSGLPCEDWCPSERHPLISITLTVYLIAGYAIAFVVTTPLRKRMLRPCPGGLTMRKRGETQR